MKISWITLRVKNLEASKKFYGELLGMEQSRAFETPDGLYRWERYGSRTHWRRPLQSEREGAGKPAGVVRVPDRSL